MIRFHCRCSRCLEWCFDRRVIAAFKAIVGPESLRPNASLTVTGLQPICDSFQSYQIPADPKTIGCTPTPICSTSLAMDTHSQTDGTPRATSQRFCSTPQRTAARLHVLPCLAVISMGQSGLRLGPNGRVDRSISMDAHELSVSATVESPGHAFAGAPRVLRNSSAKIRSGIHASHATVDRPRTRGRRRRSSTRSHSLNVIAPKVSA